MKFLFRLLPFLRKSWRLTAGAYVCLLFVTVVQLAIPVLIGKAVDIGVRQGDAASFVPLSFGILVLSALRGLFAFGQGYLAESSAQGVSYELRKALYAHIQRLSFSFHDRAQTGELMSRATADVEAVRNFSGRGLVQIISMLLLMGGVIVALIAINWLLAALSLLVLPGLVWQTARFSHRIRPMYWALQKELAALASLVQENVSGVRVVKAFGQEQREIDRFTTENDRLFERYVDASRETALNAPMLDLLSNLSIVVMLWLGGALIVLGQLTFGELVTFYTYLLQLVLPIRRGGWLMAAGSRASASAERIFEVLDTSVSVADRLGAVELPSLSGRVEFDNVSCEYHPGRPVLEQVTFHVEPGQTVALMGSTGSGKTTIANLIPRFYDVSDGRVMVDGVDVRTARLDSLRRQIGVVMQETLLFSGTIRDNIAFGRPGATIEEVRLAAAAARADEFVDKLPLGYDTIVGERGVSLSGGQRQRIAIARALLMDPRILILDEFTSSVDVATERLIQEALRSVMRDRTTFVIAHRISTVREADFILVMHRGRLVARGTHSHLLRHSREYQEVYASQLQAEADVEAAGAMPENGLPRFADLADPVRG